MPILGDTGAGACKDQALIKLNCAAIARDLVESELFGHEKGAFTGALAGKLGRFELADRGTLFLDQLGELPLDLQAKLLRVLQEGEFERVGGTGPARSMFGSSPPSTAFSRAVPGMGRSLLPAQCLPITLPPLRQRKEDVPLLIQHCSGPPPSASA